MHTRCELCTDDNFSSNLGPFVMGNSDSKNEAPVKKNRAYRAEQTRLLLEHCAFGYFANSRNVDDIRGFLTEGADANKEVDDEKAKEKGVTPLWLAVKSKECTAEIIDLLLTAGANPNFQEREYGLSVLHVAVHENCRMDVIARLLQAGATPHAVSHVTGLSVVELVEEQVSLRKGAMKLKYESIRKLLATHIAQMEEKDKSTRRQVAVAAAEHDDVAD